jgi:hypothetical protein
VFICRKSASWSGEGGGVGAASAARPGIQNAKCKSESDFSKATQVTVPGLSVVCYATSQWRLVMEPRG